MLTRTYKDEDKTAQFVCYMVGMHLVIKEAVSQSSLNEGIVVEATTDRDCDEAH